MEPRKRPWLKAYPQGVPTQLQVPEISVVDLLIDAARTHGEHAALCFEEVKYTYGELLERVERLAQGLAVKGVKKGTRVAIMMNNCPEMVVSYYAVLRLGAIVVQNNPMYTESELAFQLNDSGAEVLLIQSSLLPGVANIGAKTSLRELLTTEDIRALIDRHERYAEKTAFNVKEDIAVLQYTGGTTGVSKGVMLTHYNLVANVLQTKAFLGVNCREGRERILNVLPLFHVYGMTVSLNFSVLLKSTLYLMERYSPQAFLSMIDKEKITVFPATPTIFVGNLSDPRLNEYDLTSVHLCISGSAPIPVEVKTKFEQLTGAAIVDAYGLSEASPVTHSNPVNGLNVPGSMGIPITGTDCMIVDMETGTREMPLNEPGELIVRGPQVMKGYWNRPDETEKALRNGWLYTGDVAYMNEQGYCFIVSRKKDVIIASGYNIYPREIEEVLFQHPAVEEVAVIGIPHAYRGETVKAVIVPKEGHQVQAEEIIEFCRGRLAKYKIPTEVEFRDRLPKSAVGKILKRKLVEEATK